MSRLRYNNAVGTLGASLTSSGTTITFASAPPFSTITGSDYIPIVLEPPAGSPSANFEIVHLTAYTAAATTGTISRGQDGTTGVSHSNGVAWQAGPVTVDWSGENVNVVSASSTAQTIPDPFSGPSLQTLSDITLTGNCTFTFPTAAVGKSFTIILRQDGTGSRTVSWPGSGAIVWMSGGGLPVLSTAASAVDIATFVCTDGTHWTGAFTPGYSTTQADDQWVGSIDPYATAPTATVGTWATSVFNSTSFPNSGFGCSNSSAAQNDAIAWKLPLSAGTYTITLVVRESTNTGIATVEIDGSSVGTLDTYAASAAVGRLQLTGVTIGSSAVHEIRLLMATKNASSSAYVLTLFDLVCARTS